MKLTAKGLSLLLLLVFLALCSAIDVCEARRGKHWRPRNSPSSTQLRKKGKGKKGSSHQQSGGNWQSPKPPISSTPSPSAGKGYQNPYQPSPSPNAPVSPTPSPTNGNRHSSPKPPAPSCGKGHQPPSQSPPASLQGRVFNVVDFGAKGDGVLDDTKVPALPLNYLLRSNLIFQILHCLSQNFPEEIHLVHVILISAISR
jgi:hypothetical protein